MRQLESQGDAEIPSERIKFERDGKKVEGPMSIGRIFTASMNQKASLRAFIESFFAKKFSTDEAAGDFDVTKLVGRYCLLNVTHADRGDRTYANIASAAPLPKGMQPPKGLENAPLIFDLTHPDETVFAKLPTWLCDKINAALDEKPKRAPKTVNDDAPPNTEEGDPGPFVDDELPDAF